MKEERDAHLDENGRESRSAVLCTQSGNVILYERRERKDELRPVNDKWAHNQEEVQDGSTGASNLEIHPVRYVVAFGKQPALVDPVENTTPKTPKPWRVPRNVVLALDTVITKVDGSSQLHYTIVTGLEIETSKLTFQLIPKAKT